MFFGIFIVFIGNYTFKNRLGCVFVKLSANIIIYIDLIIRRLYLLLTVSYAFQRTMVKSDSSNSQPKEAESTGRLTENQFCFKHDNGKYLLNFNIFLFSCILTL